MSSTAALEALLFIYGDPISYKKAAEVLGIKVDEVKKLAGQLRVQLQESGRGLVLVEHDDALQLATAGEFRTLLDKVLKAELHESLTPASLETLSIVAYAGPVSRAEIDYIRGVNSTYTLRALLLRGLISRQTDAARANTYLYQASIDLLHHLGVTRVTDLPEYTRFAELVKQLRSQPQAAAETGASAPESVL